VFQGLKEGSCFAADRFFTIKYNPECSEGVEIFAKPAGPELAAA